MVELALRAVIQRDRPLRNEYKPAAETKPNAEARLYKLMAEQAAVWLRERERLMMHGLEHETRSSPLRGMLKPLKMPSSDPVRRDLARHERTRTRKRDLRLAGLGYKTCAPCFGDGWIVVEGKYVHCGTCEGTGGSTYELGEDEAQDHTLLNRLQQGALS